MRQSVADSLGETYDGSVPVRHFVEIFSKDVGLAKLRKKIINPLKGLKVAAYYGCYLVVRRKLPVLTILRTLQLWRA